MKDLVATALLLALYQSWFGLRIPLWMVIPAMVWIS